MPPQVSIYNYQYTYNKSCFLCDVQEDIIVTVRGGIIVAAQFMPSGRLLSWQEISTNQLKPIEQFFNLIQTEIDRPAAELIVTYDAMNGHPETITVDPFDDIFDDRYTITISDFHKLPRTPGQIAAQTLLDENMALWQQSGLTHYQYMYQRSCLCLPQQVITMVSGGEITEAYFVSSGEALTAEQMADLLDIEALFAIIQNAIDRDVAELNVTYNNDYGYPETSYIDYYSQILDDEITHRVMEFQILN